MSTPSWNDANSRQRFDYDQELTGEEGTRGEEGGGRMTAWEGGLLTTRYNVSDIRSTSSSEPSISIPTSHQSASNPKRPRNTDETDRAKSKRSKTGTEASFDASGMFCPFVW